MQPQLQHYLTIRYPEAMISNLECINGGWECDIYAFTLNTEQRQPRELMLRLYLAQDGDTKAARERGTATALSGWLPGAGS